MEEVPIHPVHGVQDWDAPAGAISWRRLVDTLRVIKKTGKIPPDHRSHDHLNEQKQIPVDPGVETRLIAELQQAHQSAQGRTGEKTIFGILDGFLLYWDPVSCSVAKRTE
jgi:nicotinamide/nicotinate riboside kinase